MKTMKELTKKTTVIVACASLMLVSFGSFNIFASAQASPEVKKMEQETLPATVFSKFYYQKNPTTAAQLEQKLGKPVAVRTLEDGTETRYYKFKNTMDISFHYYIIKGGNVVGSGLTGSLL